MVMLGCKCLRKLTASMHLNIYRNHEVGTNHTGYIHTYTNKVQLRKNNKNRIDNYLHIYGVLLK